MTEELKPLHGDWALVCVWDDEEMRRLEGTFVPRLFDTRERCERVACSLNADNALELHGKHRRHYYIVLPHKLFAEMIPMHRRGEDGVCGK